MGNRGKSTSRRQAGGREARASTAGASMEAKFHALLDSARDAFLIVDRQGRITAVNRRAEEMFGFRGDELLHQPVDVLVPERLRDAHRRKRRRYVKSPRQRPLYSGARP